MSYHLQTSSIDIQDQAGEQDQAPGEIPALLPSPALFGVMSSSRSARAKSASQLFTRSAGILRPSDAVLDVHGNALGMQFELGAQGAFKGLDVYVLNQCGNDFSLPKAALEVSVVLFELRFSCLSCAFLA